jgi:hypothetical protein
LTFDQYDIQLAMDALKNSVEVAQALRKETSIVSSFAGLVFGGQKKGKDLFKSMTRVQKHGIFI